MKKILIAGLWVVLMVGTASIHADFMYQEIDPICSISGTTHTSFPWEISDTSSWSIPKAYDGECDENPGIGPDDTKRVYTIMIDYFTAKEYLEPVSRWYNVTTEGRIFIKDTFFPAIQEYISENRENEKAVAILNSAVSMIKYDYYILWSHSVDYLGLTESEAQELAEQNDVAFRIGKRDGEVYAVTTDYVVGRITATIENGIVVGYSIEG